MQATAWMQKADIRGAKGPDDNYEDEIVLSIAKKVKELNTNDKLQIVLTRENEKIVDLKKRVDFANSQNADLFISIHTNIATETDKNDKGMDIYISRANTKYYAENKILATILYNYFAQIHTVNDIKQRTRGIYVIDKSNCPAALIECGYLTNPKDLAYLKGEDGQEKIAKSILESIEQYFLQKEMPDWEERKKTVSDTTGPTIEFVRNRSTGKLEGTLNGKKIVGVYDYQPTNQLGFALEDSTRVLISKEQLEKLRKQYGKSLDELITNEPAQEAYQSIHRMEMAEIEKKAKEYTITSRAQQARITAQARKFEEKQRTKNAELQKQAIEYAANSQREQERIKELTEAFENTQKLENAEVERRAAENAIISRKEQARIKELTEAFEIKQKEEQAAIKKAAVDHQEKLKQQLRIIEEAQKKRTIDSTKVFGDQFPGDRN
ncbi:MAG TPA: N-acetylmuramoyl-L-alanine amidase [Chitinophagaceae bacterium]|jgi:hypothetical protein